MSLRSTSDVVCTADGLRQRFKLCGSAWPRLADWLAMPGGPRYEDVRFH